LTIIESDRLALRLITEEDAGFYFAMLTDPDFKANIGDRGLKSVADALANMRERVFASYAANGFGMYLVTRKSDGESIGMAGLVKRDFLADVDLGYSFLPVGRGQGFATEAASLCMRLAGEQFALQRLAAIVSPGNQPSIRVLERLGFAHIGRVQFPDGGDICEHFLVELPG
jgi:ribosomal-protein-alanine N-acetyltransferase